MVEVTARMVKVSNSGGEQHMQRPKSTEICLQKSESSSWRQCRE